MKKVLLGMTAALTFAGNAFAAAKPEQIPADAISVMRVDVQALMASPFAQMVESLSFPRLFSTKEDNPLSGKQMKEATVFFNGQWIAILIEMPYQDDVFVEKAIQCGATKKTIAGKTALMENDGESAFILFNPDEVLFVTTFGKGSPGIDAAAAYHLNPATPRLTPDSPLAGLLTAIPDHYIDGAIIDIPTLMEANPGFKEITIGVPEIEKARRFDLALVKEEKAIRFTGAFLTDSNETATGIYEWFLGLKAMLGLGVAEIPALATIHKSFTVKQTDTKVGTSITLNSNDIDSLLYFMLRSYK